MCLQFYEIGCQIEKLSIGEINTMDKFMKFCQFYKKNVGLKKGNCILKLYWK